MNALAALDHDSWARARDMLGALGAILPESRAVVAPGQPLPKERPRHGKRRTFTPARTLHAEDTLALFMRSLGRIDGNAALVCIFYRGDQTIVDGDNLLKLVADAGIKAGVWHNDAQVTGGAYALELDRSDPRTVIAVAPHRSTLRRHLSVAR